MNTDMNLEVIARFIGKGHEQPVTGDAYIVRLYDADVFEDDFLGQSTLDEHGYAKITFTHSSFSGALEFEQRPDFYFVVFKHTKPIFKTKVMEDIDLEIVEKFKMGEGEVIDLGTYLIES